jgi:hypothetical protein
MPVVAMAGGTTQVCHSIGQGRGSEWFMGLRHLLLP